MKINEMIIFYYLKCGKIYYVTILFAFFSDMPGIVVFRRRWSVGSDDLIVPGVFLFTIHLIW